MIYLVLAAVYLLMISVGMSLCPNELLFRLRQLAFRNWLALFSATFLIPPVAALVFATFFHLSAAETAGLFMIGVSPGAPLLTRNLAKQGFDPLVAAGYQLWASLMIPFMVPLLVFLGGLLYNRVIWVPPHHMLPFIVTRQLLPLAIGMVLGWRFPDLCRRAQPVLNVTGNILLLATLALILIKFGPPLAHIPVSVPIAASLLAVTAIVAVRVFPIADPVSQRAFAVCNMNRNIGLALVLSIRYLNLGGAIPTLVCYALLTPLLIILYARLSSSSRKTVLA